MDSRKDLSQDKKKENEDKDNISDNSSVKSRGRVKSIICFLLSINDEEDTIYCKLQNDSTEVEFENKKLVFYEIYLENKNKTKEIPIYIKNIPYIIKVFDIKDVNFLFHHKLINQSNNSSVNMNDLEIEDEFNIFYQICSTKHSYLTSLLSDSLNILESEEAFSTFCFLLTISIKYPDYDSWNHNLYGITSIGNITKIKESDIKNKELYFLYKALIYIE